ncbi:hypothetical protein IQ254_30285 [Nodosilinea sp. LEGE 07088]|uniref:hypothetical protein n=1 Tax=Nodosilinea sp. LEGE 07088 TaxID=2777968 RepID=UPI00187EC32B|nr:hypothetical protein [Nodosilinea sp. LEGE 07088]MBE9141432.1 hypothetical protein [Nodosilinea sp. LEGE 07088]
MQHHAFLGDQATHETVGLEISLKLYSYPKPDREPVKILVIGSREAVSAIVNSLHQLSFAETFEWTDFLPAPTGDSPIQLRAGEVMKALVKYLPRA